VDEAVRRFTLDPALAAMIFAFAMVGASALVRLFDRLGGYFRKVVSPSTHKLASLEGLRGVLALSVVAHHAFCWNFFTQYGAWTTGNSVIFGRLASFGVVQFFYVSGFLFWRKLMKSGGIPFGNFYLSRFIRIGPVYYACVGAAILVGLLTTGTSLKVTISELATSVLSWLLFSVAGQPLVNGANVHIITGGVTWTLALEWMFYLSLPFLAWYARKPRRLLYFALTFSILYFAMVSRHLHFGAMNNEYLQSALFIVARFARLMLTGFGGGILIATLEPWIRKWTRFLLPWQNWLLLGSYLAFLLIPGIDQIGNFPILDDMGQIFLLAGFALVVQGADLFGLLTSRTARLLGIVSYPIYLVHGMVYYIAMRLRGGIHTVNAFAYAAETAACLAVILILATILHLVVERPTMKLSEQIARKASVPQISTA
jgi:peptidoglycan/LPS O-acetylase OafA/YrhL